MKLTLSDITIDNNYVSIKGIGCVGLWWRKYDKKVCIDWSIGESFFAETEQEVKEKTLSMFEIRTNQTTRQMKLYTEEQAKYFFECGRNFQMNGEITFSTAQEALTPIELPSDEKIESISKEYSDRSSYTISFEDGAMWVLNHIKQQS